MASNRVLAVPGNREDREKWLKDVAIVQIRPLLLAHKLNNKGEYLQLRGREIDEYEAINADRLTKVMPYFQVLADINGLTKELARTLNLQKIFWYMADDEDSRWPAEAVQLANEAKERYEAIGWGLDPATEIMDEPAEETESGEDASEPAAKRQKTTAASKTGANKRSASSDSSVIVVYIKPPKNHPIFGERGIMRGLFAVRSDGSNALSFDPTFPRKNARVFGNNDLEVGQWWPRQMACVRDGGHGLAIAGISGNSNIGVWSIVISGGGYEDLDRDSGDLIWYSTSASQMNKDTRNPIVNNDTRAFRLNLNDKSKPVRVIRSSKAGWPSRPIVGLRFDGLYYVVDEEIGKNTFGGAYVRFKLIRKTDQPPIALSRPTQNEQGLFEMVGDRY